MTGKAQYQEQTFEIAPGDAVEWSRHGDTFGCLEATGDFYVRFDNEPRSQFRKGLTFKTEKGLSFTQVRLENRSNRTIAVTVFAAKGDVRDARLTLTDAIQTVKAPMQVTHFHKKQLASGERAMLAPADPLRVEWMYHNFGFDTVFIGGPDVAFCNGIPVRPGQRVSLSITDEIWGYKQGDGRLLGLIMEQKR